MSSTNATAATQPQKKKRQSRKAIEKSQEPSGPNTSTTSLAASNATALASQPNTSAATLEGISQNSSTIDLLNAPVKPAHEEEEDEIDEEEDYDPEYETFMRLKNEETMQQMKMLLEVMSEDQIRRYETYRSAAFPKMAIKKQLLGQSVNEKMAVVVAGVAKLFVGQVVETAREVMERNGDSGPLFPEHLREAYRILQEKESIPAIHKKQRLFF